MKKISMLCAMLALCISLLGCSVTRIVSDAQAAGPEPSETGEALRAVYVPYDAQGKVLTQAGAAQGFVLRGFAGEEDFFTATLPEALYGLDGEKITPEELAPGAVLDLYGDGIMLTTYPGQYPGVTRVQVAEAGDPADALACQSFIDRFYIPPDPSEPPTLALECRTELFVTAAQALRGSYNWSWDNGDGTQTSAIACGDHVLNWDGLPEISAGQEREIRLLFSRTPGSVTVRRWPVSEMGSDNPANGQAVPVTFSGDDCALTGEPGYVYQVDAVWDEGSVQFGFLTK